MIKDEKFKVRHMLVSLKLTRKDGRFVIIKELKGNNGAVEFVQGKYDKIGVAQIEFTNRLNKLRDTFQMA